MRAHEPAHDARRPGIEIELAVGIFRTHGFEVRCKFRRRIRARPHERDAGFVFGVFARPVVREIVAAYAGVRIEAEKRLVFFRERQHELRKQRVFEHVGKIAGMEKMAVGEHVLRIEDRGLRIEIK